MTSTFQTKTTPFRVIDVLENIAGTDQVRRDLDLELFDQHILDSLGMVELMVALSDKFGIDISPAEIERAQWSTPRKIIADIERRIGLK